MDLFAVLSSVRTCLEGSRGAPPNLGASTFDYGQSGSKAVSFSTCRTLLADSLAMLRKLAMYFLSEPSPNSQAPVGSQAVD